MSTEERRAAIKQTLLAAYRQEGLWGESEPARPLPAGVDRGSDPHLAFLTLVYTISGGRDPVPLWQAARATYEDDPSLFDPQFLAYCKPKEIEARLQAHGLTQKRKTEATVWQRIGKALVMRGGGAVAALLAKHDHDARRLRAMLAENKATFPVLSGPQTAPRWLYGLAACGDQPLTGASELPVPVSADGERALASLQVAGTKVSAAIFAPLAALGRRGCRQRQADQPRCPVAPACPVAGFCRYGP